MKENEIKEVFHVSSEGLAEPLGTYTSVLGAQMAVEAFARENKLIYIGFFDNDIELYYMKEDGSCGDFFDVFFMTTFKLDKQIDLEVT